MAKTKTQETISNLSTVLIGSLLLAGVVMTTQVPLASAGRVSRAATVALEGIVVTPKRVYTRTQWLLSRPVPRRVAAVAIVPYGTAALKAVRCESSAEGATLGL